MIQHLISTDAVATGIQKPLNTVYPFSITGSIDGSGAVTATVLIKCSNDGVHWITIQTISLSGTDTHTLGYVLTQPYAYILADVTAISGTSAVVNVHLNT